ncbi:MAG: Uma2 family endonuclease, partial [Chloroflexota bacterium]
HNIINGNTQTSLNSQLADKPCSVVSSDMRLKVESKSVSFRYPDTMVICGEPAFVDGRTDTISNPTVIVEVLSPSTALKDHNEILDEYIKIDSVQVYVLISQHEAKLEVYTRQTVGEWTYKPIRGLDATVELPSIGCTLALSKLYDKTRDLQGNSQQDID